MQLSLAEGEGPCEDLGDQQTVDGLDRKHAGRGGGQALRPHHQSGILHMDWKGERGYLRTRPRESLLRPGQAERGRRGEFGAAPWYKTSKGAKGKGARASNTKGDTSRCRLI